MPKLLGAAILGGLLAAAVLLASPLGAIGPPPAGLQMAPFSRTNLKDCVPVTAENALLRPDQMRCG